MQEIRASPATSRPRSIGQRKVAPSGDPVGFLDVQGNRHQPLWPRSGDKPEAGVAPRASSGLVSGARLTTSKLTVAEVGQDGHRSRIHGFVTPAHRK